MKLPRNLSGLKLIKALQRLGFEIVRQKRSHVRLVRGIRKITVPNHSAIAPGTLSSILDQADLTVEEISEYL